MPSLNPSRARAALIVGTTGILVALALLPFIAGLIGAVVLYVVFAVPFDRTRRRLSPRTSAAIMTALAACAIVLPGAWLVSAVVQEAPGALRALAAEPALARLAALRLGGVDVGARLSAGGDALVAWLSARALAAFGSATHGLLNLVVALFGLYYLMLDGGALWRRTAAALPFSPAGTEVLRARFHSVTEAMLLGTALTAVLQGAIVGAAFRLVGLPGSLFWGVVTAFVAVLPVLGSALVWGPGALLLLAQGRPGAAATLAAIGGLVASNVDNLARPLVYERVSHIHPMVTLVGAFAGVRLFGVLGVLVGPLAISYFFELLRIYHDEYAAPRLSVAPVEPAAGLNESAFGAEVAA